MIEILGGRVFVEGRETTNPTEIGYAVIDFAENVQGAFSLSNIEIIKAKAIQNYLLQHGSNDENVNSDVRRLEGSILNDV